MLTAPRKGLMKKMQSANVLYDEENGKGFFQCYSLSVNGGVFTEIVQRTAAYSGYGAANAPFRIAAQKRLSRAKGMPKV